MRTVIVIGAGAAGMMAAITAKQEGAQVILLEHNDRVGKKILSTGNGRCNFTNIAQEPQYYRGEDPDFAWPVIQQFTAQDTIRFFSRLGIYARNRNGYMYPSSDQASSVLDVLRLELARLQIIIRTEVTITSIRRKKSGFLIQARDHTYQGDAVILAAGGKAAPVTGSDGTGYDLAKQMGHHLVPVVPALVQLKCRETFYKQLAGIRVQGKVTLYVDNQYVAEDTGEIQLTGYGISGIPVFQVSRYAAKACCLNQSVSAELDFMPDFPADALRQFLKARINDLSERTMEHFFLGWFHKKLAGVILTRAEILKGKPAGALSEDELDRLVQYIKQFHTQIEETNGFEQAQICAGGVDTTELMPGTLMSRLIKDLYFAGEIIDVDGICGGYNLQWAWSSGYTAGKGAANDPNKSN